MQRGHYEVVASSHLAGDADPVVSRFERAYGFLTQAFGFLPKVRLLILSQEDWADHAVNSVYGMPHYSHRSLYIPGQPNEFWSSLVEFVVRNSPDQGPKLRDTYAAQDGIVDLAAFFELLVVHELAHAFHRQYPFDFPRKWLMELFANLTLHTYVGEEEPESLDFLETFPRSMGSVAQDHLDICNLQEFEEQFRLMSSTNYVWFQAKLHRMAKVLYEAESTAAMERMWSTFAISDAELAVELGQKVSSHLEEFARGQIQL